MWGKCVKKPPMLSREQRGVIWRLFSLQIKFILPQINGHALFIHEADQHSVHSPHFPSPRLPGRKKTELNLALADTAVCLLRVAASSTQNKANPNVFLDSDYHVSRSSSSSEAPCSGVASLIPDWRQRSHQRMDLWCHEWASLQEVIQINEAISWLIKASLHCWLSRSESVLISIYKHWYVAVLLILNFQCECGLLLLLV